MKKTLEILCIKSLKNLVLGAEMITKVLLSFTKEGSTLTELFAEEEFVKSYFFEKTFSEETDELKIFLEELTNETTESIKIDSPYTLVNKGFCLMFSSLQVLRDILINEKTIEKKILHFESSNGYNPFKSYDIVSFTDKFEKMMDTFFILFYKK